MAAIIEPEEPITAVHIDGLAVLKIVKHCQESLPNLITGSLLGITTSNGILEITHAFPFPEPRSTNDDIKLGGGDSTANASAALLDGHEYQLEMMKMLREVNVDNNCVGWYQSMYLGSYSTTSLLQNQFSYQTDLSPNAVVILYDPMQTTHGNLVLKCLRLSKKTMEQLDEGLNVFMKPDTIFDELPVVIKNSSLVTALLHNISDGEYYGDDEDVVYDVNGIGGGDIGGGLPAYGVDTTFDRLDLSFNPYLEKHLEFLSTWVDDLTTEQGKHGYYMRGLSHPSKRNDKRRGANKDEALTPQEAWATNDAPKRMPSLLISNQIRSYCDQIDTFADSALGKLYIADSLHKDEN